MNWWKDNWQAVAVGAVTGIAGLLLWRKAPVDTSAPGVSSLAVTPGAMAIAVSATTGVAVVLTLPPGGKWTSIAEADDGANLVTSGSTKAYVLAVGDADVGGDVLNLAWTDGAGAPQTGTLTVSVEA